MLVSPKNKNVLVGVQTGDRRLNFPEITVRVHQKQVLCCQNLGICNCGRQLPKTNVLSLNGGMAIFHHNRLSRIRVGGQNLLNLKNTRAQLYVVGWNLFRYLPNQLIGWICILKMNVFIVTSCTKSFIKKIDLWNLMFLKLLKVPWKCGAGFSQEHWQKWIPPQITWRSSNRFSRNTMTSVPRWTVSTRPKSTPMKHTWRTFSPASYKKYLMSIVVRRIFFISN